MQVIHEGKFSGHKYTEYMGMMFVLLNFDTVLQGSGVGAIYSLYTGKNTWVMQQNQLEYRVCSRVIYGVHSLIQGKSVGTHPRYNETDTNLKTWSLTYQIV